MKIVAIRDIKADLWFNPSFGPSTGQFIRSFGDECTNTREGNVLAQHPEDFELYEIGEWDETTGQFKLLEKPRQIALGSNYRKP
jgi:hypothetical protein